MKTDRRDAEKLARCYRSGDLTAVWVATLNGATYLGQSDHIGSIAVGKNADLVVVKGNPSIHINDIENVELIFRDGLGFNSAKLLESVKGRFGLY